MIFSASLSPVCCKILLAAALLTAQSAFAFEPENGWWWSPSRSGTGLDLEIQDDILLVGYFTEINGQRVAYNAACNFNGIQCSGELLNGLVATGIPFSLSFPNSGINGSAVIGGNSFAIERFQLGFDQPPGNLVGVWLASIRNGPIHIGEAVLLDTLTTINGNIALIGVRDGTDHFAFAVYDAANDLYVIAVEDSATQLIVYAMNQVLGLNTMIGLSTFTDHNGNAQGDSSTAFFQRFSHTTDASSLSLRSKAENNPAISMAEIIQSLPPTAHNNKTDSAIAQHAAEIAADLFRQIKTER